MDSFRLDHIALAVPALDDAAALYAKLLGSQPGERERIEAQGVDVRFIAAGDASIELLEPHDAHTPVGRFLAQRGPGIHHVAFRVPDLQRALDRLDRDGFQLVDRTPRAGAHGRRVAFVHPRATGGVLIELVEE